MTRHIPPIILPRSDFEALSNSNICFERKNRNGFSLLLGVQKDKNGLQRLVLVNPSICSISNRVLAFLGWGPLQNVDCKIKSVSQYLEKKWVPLSISVKDDIKIQCRIKSIASRGMIKGAPGLREKAPLVLYDLNYLQNAPGFKYHGKQDDKAAWLLATDSSFAKDEASFYNCYRALKQFPEEEFEETIHYFKQLNEISPGSPYLFEKLKQLPRQKREEAIEIFKLLVKEFPQLEKSYHSLFDFVLNTHEHGRTQIIKRGISQHVKSQKGFSDLTDRIVYEYLQENIVYSEIKYRIEYTYSSDEDVSKLLECLPRRNVLFIKMEDNCSSEKRFESFCQVVDSFLAFPPEERKVILAKLPAIIKHTLPYCLESILSTLKTIPIHERESIIECIIVISEKVLFEGMDSEVDFYEFPKLFSNLLRIPKDKRKDVCIKLCQVLKDSTMMSYFNSLLCSIGDTPKVERDNVINCIRNVFMQKGIEIHPEVYTMASFLSIRPQEEIKSQTDFYVFFKEILYTPKRIDRIMKVKQFNFELLTDLTKDIPVDKRNSILMRLAPLHKNVRPYPLFNLFLALSKLTKAEEKAFFDAMPLSKWTEILNSMPDEASMNLLVDGIDIPNKQFWKTKLCN
jgi:tetratricopeptide (TPR) repeat protein